MYAQPKVDTKDEEHQEPWEQPKADSKDKEH